MSNNTIAALILTKDEGKHIARCIRSLEGVCDEVFVIDCFSKDDTRQQAESLGAKVYEHPWKNYATQFNWGLTNCPITADWVWRIDADEYLDKGLGQTVKKAISECTDDVNGIYVRKRIDFMGRPLMHGGWYPSYHLKVWRRGHGECENRWMDEHIRLFDGRAITVEEGDQVDANLNNLTWWMDKHNGYATREMADMLMMEYGLDASAQEVQPKFFGTEEQRKRWLKVKYIKAPLFLRPFINFTIRYVLKAGFLDGREGFVWHFLQGFSYRFLVDAKIFELKKRFGYDESKIKQYLIDAYLGGNETGGVIRRLLLGWFKGTTNFTNLTNSRLFGELKGRTRKARNNLVGLFSNTDNTDVTDIRLFGVWGTNTNITNQTNLRLYGEVKVRPRNSRNKRRLVEDPLTNKGSNNLFDLFSNTDNTDLTDIRLCGVWVTNTNHTNQPNQACAVWGIETNKRDSLDSLDSCSKEKEYSWLSENPCYPDYPCSKNKIYSCSRVAEERRAYAAA